MCLETTVAVRLHKLFNYLGGIESDYYLRGYLHVGNDYAVFLKLPRAHDDMLTYELYDAKNVYSIDDFKPRLLAVSKIPVQYVKDQLNIFKDELYQAKYVNKNVIPGTRVRTLREWQIDNAMKNLPNKEGISMFNKHKILRSFVVQ